MTEHKKSRVAQKQERTQKHKKNKPSAGKWLKRIFLVIVAVGCIGLFSGVGLFAYYASSAPELDEELLRDPLSSEFYDINGEVFATIGAENRQYIKYEDIPEQVRDAILATEDVRFFEHGGIDFLRLGAAVVANFRDGFGAQGASTITQQVIKNSFLQNEKKLKRKAQEAWLAIQLERKYKKEEIFEMYFNKVLMSGRIYGFGTAAQYFYGKNLNELTLDEMALLAGMPQSPNNYNPLKNPDLAEKRRNIVLSLMEQHGKISTFEMQQAQAASVTDGLAPEEIRKTFAGTKYDAFLDVVQNELADNGDEALLAEGIKVYTTLDPKSQEIVENVMNDDTNFPTDTIQSGVAVVDTKTGEIRAIGGGRNYSANREFNYADDTETRSPGSTIKPLIDYGPAIEYLKWSTGQTIVDEKITYANSNQVINNWDSKYLGTMTIREALYKSRNVPAVKTLRKVGTAKAKDFLNNLGIKADVIHESDAIGGGNITMSPIQMAASYAAFGNNGMYTDPHAIYKIVYRDGKTEKTYTHDSVVAMNDYTAYMVTDILRDVVSTRSGASAAAAIVPGLDVAGKTGTTNYSSDDFQKYNLPDTSVPDSWFTGYTTNYSIAIWSGYHKYFEPITTWEERRLPQTLFKNIMGQLSDNIDTPKFKKPSSVVEATIEIGSSPLRLASAFTPNYLRQTELFVKGTAPSQVSDEYEETVLTAPSNVQASFDNASQSIQLSWEHTPPTQEENASVSYEVSMKVDDGSYMVVASTDQKTAIIPVTQNGSTYTLSVKAIYNNQRSEPTSVSLYIENTETSNPQIPETPDATEPDNINDGNSGNTNNETPENNNNSGTNNNNNNTNNGNAGNTTTPPNIPIPPVIEESETP